MIVLALAAVGFVLGRQRAVAAAEGDSRRLHSRPLYYGWNVALFTAVPAFVALLVWLFVQPVLIDRAINKY
ncbi:phosphate ABC transporter permease family protein, partial [Salmonella enterica]|uniref:phosphate ABC transporter permease family protein n=1 Tax=Salmonella enterica TaxID=28901 RepID=UPI0032B40CF6